MIDTSKFLISVLGFLTTIYAVNTIQNKKCDIKENFGMLPSFQNKVTVEVAPNKAAAAKNQFTAVQNNYRAMLNPETPFFTVPGTYQAQLAPRMFGGDYGANITYNLPNKDNLAVPTTPIDFANSIQENYTPDTCKKGGGNLSYSGGAPLMQPDYSNGNYSNVVNEIKDGPTSAKSLGANLPVGDMTTLNSLGKADQPIIYDRYMFSNRNSRLRSQGDMIRGDLPIAPNNNGWFNVNVHPNTDLQQGAMNILGGVNNETTQQLADLIYTTSGKTQTTIAGMSLKNELGNPARTVYPSKTMRSYGLKNAQMGAQYGTNLSAGGGDIQITAFP